MPHVFLREARSTDDSLRKVNPYTDEPEGFGEFYRKTEKLNAIGKKYPSERYNYAVADVSPGLKGDRGWRERTGYWVRTHATGQQTYFRTKREADKSLRLAGYKYNRKTGLWTFTERKKSYKVGRTR